MPNKTFQEQSWQGQNGDEYNQRNPQTVEEMDQRYLQNHGVSRSELNKEFLDELRRDVKILEVGANIGLQLAFLQQMGFGFLYGIDVNRQAIETSKTNLKNIDIIWGSALDIPFRDNYFDLVFTSGVLIHISPDDVKTVMKEIVRCTGKYIWGFEYFSEDYSEVPYRGRSNLLWKANFPQLYLDSFKGLKLVKQKKINYLNDDNVNIMFLLEK